MIDHWRKEAIALEELIELIEARGPEFSVLTAHETTNITG